MPSFGELLGIEICEAREANGWTQLFVAEKAFEEDHGDKYENFVRRIGDYENGKVSRPQVKVYQPICDVLGITRQRIGALKAEAADAKSVTDDEILELRSEKGSLEQALSDLRTLSRAQLETLATRFELDRPFEASDGALIEFLTEKARDYRALRAEVDAIEDSLKRLSNLKSAARAAIDSGDLDEVEDILSRVQEVEKEEAAKTGELRAENALLRNRPDQAAALYADAADSFAILDPLEPAHRRLRYGAELYNHGLRYGGAGLHYAASHWRAAAEIAEQEADEELQGSALTNLGAALCNQGTRTTGAPGAALLAEAVTAYRAALEVRTRAAHPVDWAMTQNNLAIALRNQGSRTSGAPGAALLEEAVTAYRAALEVYTRDAHPVDWAMTQNNLGLALETQGCRTSGAPGAALLAEAVTAYRAALEVRTRDTYPVDWAMTQNNLADALRNQGSSTSGAPGAALLAEAIATFKAAIEVTTRAAHPVGWAETQYNLALAEWAHADHDTCTDPAPYLQAALAHVTAAVEVFNRQHMPYHFDTATKRKQDIETRLAGLSRP